MKWGGVTTPYCFWDRVFIMIIKSSNGKVISLNKIIEGDGKEKLLLQVSRDDDYQVCLTFDESEANKIIGELNRLFSSTKKDTICIKTTDTESPFRPIQCDAVEDEFYTRWRNLYSFKDIIPLTN